MYKLGLSEAGHSISDKPFIKKSHPLINKNVSPQGFSFLFCFFLFIISHVLSSNTQDSKILCKRIDNSTLNVPTKNEQEARKLLSNDFLLNLNFSLSWSKICTISLSIRKDEEEDDSFSISSSFPRVQKQKYISPTFYEYFWTTFTKSINATSLGKSYKCFWV